jgi:hypothetical protein
VLIHCFNDAFAALLRGNEHSEDLQRTPLATRHLLLHDVIAHAYAADATHSNGRCLHSHRLATGLYATILSTFLFMHSNMKTHSLIEILNSLRDCHPFARSRIFDICRVAQIQRWAFPTNMFCGQFLRQENQLSGLLARLDANEYFMVMCKKSQQPLPSNIYTTKNRITEAITVNTPDISITCWEKTISTRSRFITARNNREMWCNSLNLSNSY